MKRLFVLLALSSFGAGSALAAQKTVTLSAPGINCAACPITVKKALEKIDGVLGVKVDFNNKQVMVTFDDAMVSVEKLTKATADAGYPSTVAGTKQ